MSQFQESEAAYVEVSLPPMAKESFAMDENKCYDSLKVAPQKNAAASASNKIVMIVTTVLVLVLILAVAACCIAFTLEISKLKSKTVSAEQEQSLSTIIADRLDSLNNSVGLLFKQLPETACGGVIGRWTRVAELDMTNSSHQCPSGLRQRTDSSIRTCVRDMDPAGCSAVQYSTANIQYSRVCGKVRAYQYGATDAFLSHTQSNISSAYVDGVSLTHGDPMKHIWIFAAALAEVGAIPATSCHCLNSTAIAPSSFIGTDYFCDTGIETIEDTIRILHDSDPLWDGAGCGPTSTCCSFNTPPWFHKQLPQPTTDDIEMRVCRNSKGSVKDVAIEMVEIYIQ